MDAIHETMIAAIRSALAAAGYEKGSSTGAWAPHVRELVAALAAYEKAAAAPAGYTVCLQGVRSSTTHVTYHEVTTMESAIELAKAECRENWDWIEEAELHCMAVFAGDVAVLHWEDQA